jgi:hypothetical protein
VGGEHNVSPVNSTAYAVGARGRSHLPHNPPIWRLLGTNVANSRQKRIDLGGATHLQTTPGVRGKATAVSSVDKQPSGGDDAHTNLDCPPSAAAAHLNARPAGRGVRADRGGANKLNLGAGRGAAGRNRNGCTTRSAPSISCAGRRGPPQAVAGALPPRAHSYLSRALRHRALSG